MVEGDTAEQGLIAFLSAAGFEVTKSPASGSRTDRNQPDVIAGQDGNVFVFESKAGDPPVYVGAADDCERGNEVAALDDYAAAFEARPFISHRKPGRVAYFLYDPVDLRETGKSRVIDDTADPVAVLDDNDDRDGWTTDDVLQKRFSRLVGGTAVADGGERRSPCCNAPVKTFDGDDLPGLCTDCGAEVRGLDSK